MVTLHIEHAITDLDTWTEAFRRFAGARTAAGVRNERVCCPADDARSIMVELDFDTAAAAEAFRDFLTAQVWSNPAAAPALAGRPETRILDVVDVG